MKLTNGTEVSANVSRTTGGLTYIQMMDLAEKAQMRQTLEKIADEAVSLFEKVIAHD